jgi:hypothetical protein
MEYKKINNYVGWGVFLIATLVYLLTVAPTASFWDCGEFIAVSNELEVPHPPGAPLYLLIGRLFAIFAPTSETVAYAINLVSVFSSSFTILFLFWTITMLGKKILAPNEENPDKNTTLSIMLAGALGALTCTFLDSFWFNAVEAEVYAMSSLFTAAVVWLMLKWEARANEPNNLKWIVLIAYLMGLSIGVHLLNLLTIPSLALIYYYKKTEKPTFFGVISALLVGAVILAFIQYGVIQTTFDIIKQLEIFLTGYENEQNHQYGLGLPFGTGLTLGLLILIGGLIFLIYYTQKNQMPVYNAVFVSILMIYIGYSSYALIFIRSQANPPIDENNPEDVMAMLSYLKREQYGDRPLFFGPMYNARPMEDVSKKGKPIYLKVPNKKRYFLESYRKEPKYPPGTERFFPRMYSTSHYNSGQFGYFNFVKNKGSDPNDPYDDSPTGQENMKFFWKYQVYHMYLRYFLWNFVGRESDVQDSDWEDGLIKAPGKNVPEFYRKDETRNHYYFLPLIMGLLGLFWHYSRSKKDFLIVLTLFFFTGLAIIIYLNQTPSQPRERDYSYAGSFQTFCIWIGLGVLALKEILEQNKIKIPVAVQGGVTIALVPGIMAAANWKDHSRAGNYVAPDSAYNLLNSCAPNAILFTNGDNDTFPLWYLQEVEGVRTDVRIVNLSLLNTDWYIDQLKNQKSNDSDPLPISLPLDQYIGERNAYSPFPTQVVEVPVNKEDLVKNGVVKEKDLDKVESPMLWEIKSRNNQYLLKQDLLIKDMILTNAKQGWKRPIYFAITIPQSSYVNLMDYFQLEGLAYRVVPIKSKGSQYSFGRTEREIMKENLLKKFRFRGLNDPSVFNDANIKRMVGNFRSNFFRLAMSYIEEIEVLEKELQNPKIDPKRKQEIEQIISQNQKEAKEVLDYSRKVITDEAVPTESYNLAINARAYMKIKEEKIAEELIQLAKKRAFDSFTYDKIRYKGRIDSESLDMYACQLIMRTYTEAKKFDKLKAFGAELSQITGDPQFEIYTKQFAKDQSLVDSVLQDSE